MNKKIGLPIAIVMILGLGVLGAGFVGAQTPTDGTKTIVQRIAEKFNLNQTDVQAVFDEEHEEHHKQMQVRVEENLNQAVKDGKITEAQKQAILTKFSEMKDSKPDFEKFRSMTEEERRQVMEQKRTELESWAKENNLDLTTLQELMGHKKGMFFRHGMKGMWMKGTPFTTSPTVTQ